MKRKIHYYSNIPSTNKEAFSLAEKGAMHGEVVRAETQTEGRGRLGKSWNSPAGLGLYFSLIVRPQLAVEEYPKITMTSGLAIAKALEHFCNLPVQLKWPNDIYIGGKKMCGILAEASSFALPVEQRFVIIGIGMNVATRHSDFPKEIQDKATSLLIESSKSYEMDLLLEHICVAVLAQIRRLEQEGFAGILNDWKKRDFLKGKLLSWVTNAGMVIEGVSEGPDIEGRLLVRDQQSVLHEVISGDISLAKQI